VRSSTCELRSGLLGLLLFLEALSSLFSLGFLFEAQLVEFREVAFAALALAVGLVGHDRLLPRSSILEPPKRGRHCRPPFSANRSECAYLESRPCTCPFGNVEV
jgi:hypothetical protein